MRYFFQKGLKPEQLVVAFHGTGGNVYQLLSTIAALYPQASVLSYLGNEGTGNHRRFFAPLEKGQLPRANFHKKITMNLDTLQNCIMKLFLLVILMVPILF